MSARFAGISPVKLFEEISRVDKFDNFDNESGILPERSFAPISIEFSD